MKNFILLISFFLALVVALACAGLLIFVPGTAHGKDCPAALKSMAVHDYGRIGVFELTIENLLKEDIEAIIVIIRYLGPFSVIDEDAKLLDGSTWGGALLKPLSSAEFHFTTPFPRNCSEVYIHLRHVNVKGRGWIECP